MGIQECFNQNDYHTYAKMEKLLVLAASRKPYSQTLQEVVELYGSDFSVAELGTHLELLNHVEIEHTGKELTFQDIHNYFKQQSSGHLAAMAQVVHLKKCVLLMPSTNAVSERSASALRRLKSYLHIQ